MEKTKDLIVVKQLPIIEEKLKELSVKIDEDIKEALAMKCTEANKTEVKNKKAELKKQFEELEEKRKEVKEKVLDKYNQFLEVYKKYVTEKFTYADKELKTKIDSIENEQKQSIKEKMISYFNEYAESKKLDFVQFEDLNWKVKLGDATEKESLTNKTIKAIQEFIDNKEKDIQIIDNQQYKDEVMIEYKKHYDVAKAIQEVSERHKELERIQQEKENTKEQEITDEIMINKIDSLTAPKIEETTEKQQIIESAFVIRTTNIECLRELKKVAGKYKSKMISLTKKGDVYYEQ